ncbi:hypothetical protein HBI81_252850 [Parastagonospora nodorum]|nr:hypothetical protein HBI64_238230 [Parastagonospora nodorum]KAH6510830.1 hypothetical protein HBI81_252850 [Parastagonospora nodorum]
MSNMEQGIRWALEDGHSYAVLPKLPTRHVPTKRRKVGTGEESEQEAGSDEEFEKESGFSGSHHTDNDEETADEEFDHDDGSDSDLSDPALDLSNEESKIHGHTIETILAFAANNEVITAFVANTEDFTDLSEVVSLKDAMRSSEWPKWQAAMKGEYSSLQEHKTWIRVRPSKGQKTLTGKWVLKRKMNPNGTVKSYKARYVARGFQQRQGPDYDETFATVLKTSSYRLPFALAARYGWHVHQMDIKTAFLHGDIEEDIYMEQPEGFVDGSDVLKLLKALYGLKQAPRQWYKKLTDHLISQGWKVSQFDASLYFHPEKQVVMGIYFDDISLAGASLANIETWKQALSERFALTDMGTCKYYFGIEVNRTIYGIHLHQQGYIRQLLERYHPEDITVAPTPYFADLSEISKNTGQASK